MPSSRIIKSQVATEEISSFSFHAISGAVPKAEGKESPGAFTPLGIFDTSEVGAKFGLAPKAEHQETVEEPPGRFVSDDEMQKIQDDTYQRGLEDGKNLAEKGLLHVFKVMRTAAEDLQILREKVLHESEDHLLALVMAIAKKVILREVQQDRQVVIRVIEEALADLNQKDNLVIRVHPDDHALLAISTNEALKREIATSKFELKPDSTIGIGGCLVETGLGTVDAALEAQLEEIFRTLLEEQAGKGTSVDED